MRSIIRFETPVSIYAHASAVGGAEADGPLGALFDFHDPTDRFGADTWEKGEESLSRAVLNLALSRAGQSQDEIDLLFSGDLQNQCVASSAGCGSMGIPYCGLYGACSTSCEGLLLASLALSASRETRRVAVVTTSHNAAAERQFRLPLEYGGQRTPTAQWTATAGGAFLLARSDEPTLDPVAPRITAALVGRALDSGVKDGANMGAAMAPAAADTILRFFSLSGERPSDYDRIVTGDLGAEGSALLVELLRENGLDLAGRHRDCGVLLFDPLKADVHAGGSGCGCSASVLSALFLPALERGELRRILFLATGALMSPSNLLQGGSILGIAPLVVLEAGKPKKGGTT